MMKSKDIIYLLVDNDIVIEDVIDAIIEENGIVGVGLISLADDLKAHILRPLTWEQNERIGRNESLKIGEEHGQ